MPQFDIFTFVVQFFNVTVFFIVFYLCYTHFFLKQFFYSIRFRQKLLILGPKLKMVIKPTLIFTEICKTIKIN